MQRAWAIRQAQSCAGNTDSIAEQVRRFAKARVDTYMTEHPVCSDADLTTLNQALQHAETKRREGILRGIDERVTILRQELFRIRSQIDCGGGGSVVFGGGSAISGGGSAVSGSGAVCGTTSGGGCDPGTCDVAGCGSGGTDNSACLPDGNKENVGGNCMCCRNIAREGGRKGCRGSGSTGNVYCKEQANGEMICQRGFMPLGSPLAVDLDADGLSLSSQMVSFDLLATGDGGQRVTWIGSNEASSPSISTAMDASPLARSCSATKPSALAASAATPASRRCAPGIRPSAAPPLVAADQASGAGKLVGLLEPSDAGRDHTSAAVIPGRLWSTCRFTAARRSPAATDTTSCFEICGGGRSPGRVTNTPRRKHLLNEACPMMLPAPILPELVQAGFGQAL